MKRILLVFTLVVCLLVAGQTASFAETVSVVSKDDPTFNGGTVTVPSGDDWATNPSFMSGDNWQPIPLSAKESAMIAAKEESVTAALAADAAANTGIYPLVASLDESMQVEPTGTEPTEGTVKSTLEDQPTFSTKYLPYYISAWFKIPNYNQGQTPYCGPFSALQILRYKRYSEYNLLKNLINEMYVSGQGTDIYRLAKSLRRRIRYGYYVSTVANASRYAYMHRQTVGVDRMPIDNLVRIYAGKLGKYRKYHRGHFIDSNGYYFSMVRPAHFLYITDTYQEYVNGVASGTLGPQWVSFYQMYYAVRYHPRQSVVW
jgi:hypothetical protein